MARNKKKDVRITTFVFTCPYGHRTLVHMTGHRTHGLVVTAILAYCKECKAYDVPLLCRETAHARDTMLALAGGSVFTYARNK